VSEPGVRYEAHDGVARITLDAPQARNVLTGDSLAALSRALDDASLDDAVRVVVLAATGRAFCAGADLRGTGSEAADFTARYTGVLARLLDHPKPTIARVQGHVAGGGNGLVAGADLSVAVADAKFAFSEVRVGAVPAIVSVVALQRMPRAQAIELFLTGERVSAERAREAGLLTAVVADEAGLDAAVAEWVAQLRLGGPEAMRQTKQVLRRVPAMERGEAFAWAEQVSAAAFSSSEAAEGMAAFIERRPPAWAPPGS
jgi:enoyl-CoA hydratase/carnithine racemase